MSMFHMLVCLDLCFPMFFMLASTCLDVHSHVYMHISMLICVDRCVYMLKLMLSICSMLFPMLDQYVCVILAMFMCLDLGYVCHAMCYCSPFVPLSHFLAFWPIDSNPI